MNIKFLLPLILFSTLGRSQNSSSWKHLITKDNDSKTGKYYLSSTTLAKKNALRIVKVVDDSFCIVEPKNEVEKNSLKNNFRANDLWKLPADFKNHDAEEEYLLATDNVDALRVDLNSIEVPYSSFETKNYLLIKSNSKKILNFVINLNSVKGITKESLLPVVESKIIDQNYTINQINKAKSNFPLTQGENQIVSIKDEFLNKNDIDLVNKHIPSTTQSSKVSDHATAMATIVSGLGNSSVLGKGVAMQAKIQSSDFLKITPDEIASLQGATVQNHSYGTEIENFYGSLAASYDTQLYENPFLTHLFSSGNRGLEGSKTITGNFKQSKNSIVVGCIDQNEQIMPFSSIGPAFDGRVKPEVVAYSTQGTSNATAITTGIVTLMQEHFKINTNTVLNNALTKAILINSAKDLGPIGPDFMYGFGSVNANKCLQTISESRFITGNIKPNETNMHAITLPINAKNLKITLVWNDIPANVNSAISLVNDLDLQVISANNTTYFPWILDPNTPQKVATTGKDKINTVEQVVVSNFQPGLYTISVNATSLSNTSQDYSIAYEYELENTFEWSYPILNDNFPFDGKSISPFKWESTYSGKTGELAITFNDGQSWELITSNVNLDKEQLTYSPNEERFTAAKLKMTIDGTAYVSDRFTISYDLHVSTSLVCDGTTEINWNKPADVNLFSIYQLTGDQLQFKELTAATTYTYTDGKNYSVSPVFGNNEGIKSESTLQYEANSNCYFELAFAEVFEDNKIQISASLFSLFNIKKIELIKISATSEQIISTIIPLNSKSFQFLDENPTKGTNLYKIKLTLANNTILMSTIVTANYLANNLFLVTPTVLRKNQEILIEAKNDEEAVFYLYDLNGQNVLESLIQSKTSSIPLTINSSGIYIYKIVTKKGVSETGKIVIL